MTQPVALTVEAGLIAEQDLLAQVCTGDSEFGLLFWQPSDRALVMPRRLNRLPGFDAACEVSAAAGWPVLLRETGGEPVPQSAATINIALVYAARAAKVTRIESKPLTVDSATRFVSCLMSWAVFHHWGKSKARSVMAASTSTSTGARWSAPLSAGARARAERVR